MADARRNPWKTAGLLGATVFALHGVAGYASMRLSHEDGLAPTLWPSSAIALVLLLRGSRSWRDDALVALAVLGAEAGLNLIVGLRPAASLAYALIGLLTLLLQVWLARRFAPLAYPTPADGWRFAGVVGLPAPLLGGLAITATAALFGDPAPWALGWAWCLAQILGFLLVAPFGMTVSAKQTARLGLETRRLEAAGVAALLCLATIATFAQDRYPLLFMVLPPLLLATFRFRLAGAALGAAAVAVIALVMTNLGHGPVMLVQAGSGGRMLILQLFVTTACLTMLPIAAALNQRDRFAAAIDRQRLAAIAANEAKSRLLAHVSHEVRSPLSAILNFSAFVEAGVDRRRLNELATLIGRNGEVLRALADDLLDLRAQESGVFSIRCGAVPVGQALDDIRASLAPQARDAATVVLIHPSAGLAQAVAADPRRYRQILANLTSNAIKYGAGHGPVTVTVTQLIDGFVRVEIANGGPGIPIERQNELFQPFARAGAEATKVEGAGLGLALTKQLVEMQGGRIAFESAPHQRTRFWVDLPRAA